MFHTLPLALRELQLGRNDSFENTSPKRRRRSPITSQRLLLPQRHPGSRWLFLVGLNFTSFLWVFVLLSLALVTWLRGWFFCVCVVGPGPFDGCEKILPHHILGSLQEFKMEALARGNTQVGS